VLRGINWREVFPFTHIFRAFRIAVHPSKLVLGLVALLVLYAGGRVMDAVWLNKHLAMPREAQAYEAHRASNSQRPFGEELTDARRGAEKMYASKLLQLQVLTDPKVADEAAATFDRQSEVRGKIMFARDDAVAKAEKAKTDAYAAADKLTDAKAKDDAKRAADEAFIAARQSADETAFGTLRKMKLSVPHGIFEELFDYQVGQINGIARSIAANAWLAAPAAEPAAAGAREGAAARLPAPQGVVPHLTNVLLVGPTWLFKAHWVYGTLFTILFLAVWAVFGGAISRIAAVQVARDEKISVRQALRFSINKVLSFAFAPLIPLAIVLVIGLIVAAGGLLFYIPWVGPILGGALLFLALIAGVVATLVLFGTVGGFNLMFPTIAVEGSDSFDAISRSFSYVFARPWRMAFYTAVALVYFALTYIFVRFFVWVVLAITHGFTTWFLGGQAGYYFEWMWPAPESIWVLPYDINFPGLKFSEDAGAFLMAFWNYMFIGLVGAFAISFYLSVNTIIYALMRREVDATELDDVFVEETEDDLMEPAAAPATVPPLSPAPAPAAAAPSF
ncbi:MAG TPA: hypothetical protein VF796_29605, partial [Humisphaera sp.]